MATRDRTGGQPEIPPEVPPEYVDAYLAAFHRALAEGGMIPVMREPEEPTTRRSGAHAVEPPAAAQDTSDDENPPTAPFEAEVDEPAGGHPVDDEVVDDAPADDERGEPDPDDEAEQEAPPVERMEVWAFEPPERNPDELFPPAPLPPPQWDFEEPWEPVEEPQPPKWDFEPPAEPDPDWRYEDAPELPLDWAFEPVEEETGQLPAVDEGAGGATRAEAVDAQDAPARRRRPLWIYVLVFLVVAAVLMVGAYFLGMALSGTVESAPVLGVIRSAGV